MKVVGVWSIEGADQLVAPTEGAHGTVNRTARRTTTPETGDFLLSGSSFGEGLEKLKVFIWLSRRPEIRLGEPGRESNASGYLSILKIFPGYTVPSEPQQLLYGVH